MIKITIAKEVNIKWLTYELQVAGVDVVGVGIDRGEDGAFISAYAEVDEADEAAALAVIEAHNPLTTPDILEKADLRDLESDIANELTWIEGAITEIDTGLAAVDAAFSTAAQRAIIRGLLQNQRRILLEQRRELKAWRYVVRRLR